MGHQNIEFLPLGALLQRFQIDGHDIVQGFATSAQYIAHNRPYFGETIGRIANRVSGAKINRLNGSTYELPANDGRNSLHGGWKGWGKQVFDGPIKSTRDGKPSTLFKYLSHDGDEGYPGTVELRVYYSVSIESQGGPEVTTLDIEYEAEMIGDEDIEETAVAVTNHSYFNLANASSIDGTEATLFTDKFLVVDDESIPTGSIESWPGVQAGKKFSLGAQEPFIDHCFIVNDQPSTIPLDTRALPLTTMVHLHHPKTGLHLEVCSTEPAFQFYTGEFIDVPEVDGLAARGPRSGIAVEPSRYVNAVNVEDWRSMVVLKRGDVFGSRIRYRAWSER